MQDCDKSDVDLSVNVPLCRRAAFCSHMMPSLPPGDLPLSVHKGTPHYEKEKNTHNLFCSTVQNSLTIDSHCSIIGKAVPSGSPFALCLIVAIHLASIIGNHARPPDKIITVMFRSHETHCALDLCLRQYI